MKIIKNITSLTAALMLTLSLSVTAFAANSTVEYTGHNTFGFAPGSTYTKTDLFDNFKGVMPGDTLTETVIVSNSADCCDFIKIYMRAVPHDGNNPLSTKVAASSETLASMTDFLKQLTMTVKQDGKVIFNGKANETGGLKENVLLGTLRKDKSVTLEVSLTVPQDLGNEYANRTGEVDWLFTVEEYDDAAPDTPKTDDGAKPATSPKTGDDTNIMAYAVLLAAGAAGAVTLLIARRNKKKLN